jgi:hypothetical protein
MKIVIYYNVAISLRKSLINSVSYENYETEYSKKDDFIGSVYYIDTHQWIRCMYNAILWHVWVEFLVMGNQQCLPVLLLTYVAVNNVINTASVAIEAQQRVLCIVALHMSLTTI